MRRRRSGLEWAIRIVGALLLAAAGAAVGMAIRGHPAPGALGDVPATTTSTRPPLVTSGVTTPSTPTPNRPTASAATEAAAARAGCLGLGEWDRTVLFLTVQAPSAAFIEDTAGTASGGYGWQAVSAMEALRGSLYHQLAQDARLFVNDTAVAETNGNVTPLKSIAASIGADCRALSLPVT